MAIKNLKIYLFFLILATVRTVSFGQESVPLGIYYQAVARDNSGKELANKDIDVRFSIISENPLGTVVYQELHSGVITSKFGVFSLVIGHGTPTGGTSGELSQINWSQAFHYLKVEVKFESDFIEMGTMQFLSVPYALYAQKSLEPGPEGPKGDVGPQGLQGVQGLKGDQGDPASDDQVLSFDGTNLTISGGNTLNISTLNVPHQLSLLGDTLSIMGGNKVGLTNQIQDLQLDVNNKLKINKNPSATEIDMTRFLDDKQQLSFNSTDNTLAISGGNTIDLTPIKQDLQLAGNTLSITNKTTPAPIDLSKYLQQLIFTPADNKLEIVGGNTIDLTSLKNDGDSDPLNEIQDLNLNLVSNKLTITNKTSPTEINLSPYLDNTDSQSLTYNPNNYNLSISGGNNVNIGNLIAFRARKTTSETGLLSGDYDFITPIIDYNDGSGFDGSIGIFTAPVAGIYTFNVGYFSGTFGDPKVLKLILNGTLYETLNSSIAFLLRAKYMISITVGFNRQLPGFLSPRNFSPLRIIGLKPGKFKFPEPLAEANGN
ncbi:MAG: hypothetical protein NTV31_09705 [Bacteroidia bacterium]|nr:hypothetical protein [Bacteroidia bacterium]